MPSRKKCCFCSRWTSDCRSLSSSAHEWYHELLRAEGKAFDPEGLYLCARCVCQYYQLKETHVDLTDADRMDASESSDGDREDEEFALNNVLYAGSGHKNCVICRKETAAGMVTMPKEARLDLLIVHSMYAPRGVRCCDEHLAGAKRLKPDVPVVMEKRRVMSAVLSATEMIETVGDLLALVRIARDAPRLDFSDLSLGNEDYLTWTGWSKTQFDYMYGSVAAYLRSSSNRHSRNAFAIFWIKLKTNLSFRQIGSIFNVSGDAEHRRKRMADAFDSVRVALINHFVPLHLGVGHLTREVAKEKNTSFSIEFFGNHVTIIWDATYIFIGKSSDNQINRKTYSGQK